VVLRTRGALKIVASSLTDVWQQLFEQQDITVICIVHFHPRLHENHTSVPALEEPTETDTQYQAIDQCQDCFNACLKAKKTTLNICYDVFLFNFMT